MKWGPTWRKFHKEFDLHGPGGRKTTKTLIFWENQEQTISGKLKISEFVAATGLVVDSHMI